MKRTLAVLALAVLTQTAQAQYIASYSAWAALPEGQRSAYVMGAFDQLITMRGVYDEAYWDYLDQLVSCLRAARMDSNQLATNVLQFAAAKPELHTAPLPVALFEYLSEACGPPP